MSRARIAALAAVVAVVAIGLAGVFVARGDDRGAGPCRSSAETEVPQPTAAQLSAAGLAKLPLAPADARVDLVAPPFSDPTRVTNQLFPISDVRSAVLNGSVGGKPFKTETTLLPEKRIMEWSPGQCVEVLVSQYLAYSGGRIEEVALDRYAQADDGSVWYLGEDVFNYENGVIADTEGTWFAGVDGPAAMIMPARPEVGDAYRSENVAGQVFEEVTVAEVGKTVPGPHGDVRGAITVRELHDDGTTEEKVFAPGYGEFFTGGGGDVEALALAVPTDAIQGGVPPQLQAIADGADGLFAPAGGWASAERTIAQVQDAWTAYRRSGDVPRRLAGPTEAAIEELARQVENGDRAGTRAAAVGLTQAVLDLELQYRPVAEVDRGRFDAWLRQLLLDAQARDHRALLGDVATLEWIRDRIARIFDPDERTRLDALLKELRTDAGDGDMGAAIETASRLRQLVAR